jgi:transcription elongation factor GreA
MKRAPLTVKGAQALRAELDHLKSVVRPQITAAIAEARAHGDLKENAEYHAAREQQSFSEGRINELENTLASAEIIDVSKLNPGSRIVFGALVELMELHSEQTVRYQIVGDLEADFKQRKISVSSPVGRALIGRNEGDTVDIQTPSGIKSYEIMGVEYET